MPDITPAAPADDRTSMLAELRTIERGAAESPPPPAAVEEALEEGVVEDAVDEEVEEETPADPPAPAAQIDPDTARRLSQVQKQEKRARESLAAERRTFEEERDRWREENREQSAAVARFEKLKGRARLSLAEVAKELGISEDDFEYHAEQLYRRSPKGMKDPRHKALAEQSMREREQADRIAKLEEEIKADREARTSAETTAAQRRAADEYLGQVTKAAGAETPLVKAMLAKNPERARARLVSVALELAATLDGETPAPAEVAKALEADLREWGLTTPASGGTDDASTPPPKAVGPKKNPPGAGEKTRPSQKQQVSESRPASDPEQQRKEIVEALKGGSFSDE